MFVRERTVENVTWSSVYNTSGYQIDDYWLNAKSHDFYSGAWAPGAYTGREYIQVYVEKIVYKVLKKPFD